MHHIITPQPLGNVWFGLRKTNGSNLKSNSGRFTPGQTGLSLYDTIKGVSWKSYGNIFFLRYTKQVEEKDTQVGKPKDKVKSVLGEPRC